MKYLDLVKKVVKKSKYGSYFFSMFPKSILYTESYDQVVNLHKLYRKGETTFVEIFLRERLVDVLKNALIYVPWYKNNVQIDVNSITKENVYEKLHEFPFTSKQIVMENYNDFISTKYPRSQLKIGSTEGTTGQGIMIANTRREVGVQMASFEVSSKKFKFDFIKTKTIRIGLEALKTIDEYPCQRCGNRLLVSPIHLVPKYFNMIYNDCVKFEAEAIHSYPTLLFLLAQYINDNNLEPIKVKMLQLSSDTFLWQHYKLFKKVFGSPEILCSYNMSEHVALGWAEVNETDKSIGYQLDNIYAYNENLEDEYGRKEIIGTSYWNEAMPFIRYRTQDYGVIDDKGFISHLDGRGQNYLTTKTGEKIAGISILSPEDYIWDYITAFQFVQREKGKIIIQLVTKRCYTDEIGQRMIGDMEKKWPGLFDYSVEVVDEIQRGRSTKIQSIIVEI
jgi:phenylacetate-CoA ligase